MSTHTLFAEHLKTNCVPSELEVPLLEQIIAERRAEVEALTLEIEQAGQKEEVSVLEDQRAACLESIQEHLALLSPARRIPMEVLEVIFKECRPGTEAGPPGITSPHHPSISLSRGNHSEWVLEMGKLVKAIDVWIERAGTSPLTVLVDSDDSSQSTLGVANARELSSTYSTLVRTIKPSAARWTQLTLHLVTGADCNPLLDLMQFTPTSLPLLKMAYLDISAPSKVSAKDLYGDLQEVMKTTGLFSTPTLRSLTLRGVWGDTCGASLMSPWAPLTSLHVHSYIPGLNAIMSSTMGTMHLIHHLYHIPTLIDVSFFIQGQSCSTRELPISDSASPLEIPNLRSLMLTGALVPKKFRSFLSFPALHTLHLPFENGVPVGVDSGLVGCILSSSAHLKSLTFCPDSVDEHALVKIYQNLPSVEILTLDSQGLEWSAENPGVGFPAITELSAHGVDAAGVEGDMRCPQLRHLNLKTTRERYEADAVEQALVDFIVKRRGTSCVSGEYKLEEVSVAFYQGRGGGSFNVVQKLSEQDVDMHGLAIRLDNDV